MAVEPRLDYLSGGKLDHHEQARRPERHRPAWIDGKRDNDWKRRRDNRTDIGNKAQQHPEDAPEPWVRDADEPQPATDQQAETRIDGCLRQEIAAKPSGGIIQRYGCAPKIARPGEPNKPVAQIFALEQKEDDENNYNASRCQGLEQCGRNSVDELQWRRGGLADLNRNRALLLYAWRIGARLVRCGFVVRLAWLLDLLVEIFHHLRSTVDHATLTGRIPQRMDFLPDVGLISRQVRCQMRELSADERTDAADY